MTGPQRSLVALPAFASWPRSEQSALARMDEAAARLSGWTAGRSDGGLRGGPPGPKAAELLQHSLSPVFPPPAGADIDRSRREWRVLAPRFGSIAALAEGEPPEPVLRGLADDLTGSGEFRATRAQTAADRTGRYIRYPPSCEIAGRLLELGELFASKADRPAAFDAVVALVAISNLHPFVDGNGRVARVCFNGLLQRRAPSPPSIYIPLHAMAVLSRGGFIVRIRLAEIRGDWLPLLDHLAAAMLLWEATLKVRAAEEAASAPSAIARLRAREVA